jgi:hypothetical protein
MPEFIHNFTQGKMNHDLDERMVPNGQYRDALNVTVATSESSNVGALQNLKGNIEKKGSPASNGNWAVDYISNLVNPVCIGSIRHEPTECIYWLVATDRDITKNAISVIAEFNQRTGDVTPIIVDTQNVLNFSKENLVTGINIIDDLLFFTDNVTEPKKINIKKFKTGSSNGGSPKFNVHTKIPKYYPSNKSYEYDPSGASFTEADVTVIKKSPLCKPDLTLATSTRSQSGEEVPGTGVSPLNTTYNFIGNFPASGDKYTNFTFISQAASGTEASQYEPLPTYQEWFEDSQLDPSAQKYTANMESVTLIFNQTPTGWEDGDIITISGSAVGDYNNIDEYVLRLEIIAGGINGNEVEFHIMSTPSTILRFSDDNDNLVSWEAILEEKDPMFEFEFPRFAYRWKYENGEYSTFSPFTEPAFEGDDFEYLSSDGYNLGMQNHLRSLIISGFNWGSQEVVEVDILMKKSRSNNIYVVDTLKREDKDTLNVTPPNTFKLKTELIGAVVEANQLLRPWDNVPRAAKAQEVSANRLIFANYLQNFNVPKLKLNLTVSSTIHQGFTNAVTSEGQITSQNNFTRPLPSIKSIRKYQVGIVLQDAYGRQTPVFSNPEATFNLDKAQAEKTSKFIVQPYSMGNYDPSFTHYKYFIKDTSNEYYNLALDRYYFAEDGNVWLSFPSSEASKVQIDSYLILKKQHNNDSASTGPSRYKVLDVQSQAPDFISSSKKVIASATVTVIGGFKEGFSEISFTSEVESTSIFATSFNGDNYIRISSGSSSTDIIGIKSGGRTGGSNSPFVVRLDTPLGSESLWMGTTGLLPGVNVQIDILSEEVDRLPEFEGRVFVKINRDTDFDTNIVKPFQDADKRYGIVASITFNTARHIMPADKYHGLDNSHTWGFWHGDHGQPGKNCKCAACPSNWRLPSPFNTNGSKVTDQNSTQPTTVPNSIVNPNPNYQMYKVYRVGCATNETMISMVYVGSRNWASGSVSPGSVAKGSTTGDFWARRAKKGEKIRIVHIDGRVSEPYEIKNHWRQAHGRGCKYGCPGASCNDQKDLGGNNRMALALELDKPIDETWVGNRSVASMQNIKGYEIVEEVVIDDNSVLTSNNPAIFETEPKEAVDIDIYYEASCAYPISDLTINNPSPKILDYFNCYSFGNGVESDRIRDDFNAPTIGKGVKVSTILDEPYMEERRSSGLIFSQIYNSQSGINRLNQFIQAQPITKDLNPEYGSIQKLHSRNTNLVTLCEDKCLKILANKDALFNADGSSNVTSNKAVLGQAVPYAGQFGISDNPESFASYGFRSYFSDKNRGAVIRLSQDGITNIALKGMSDFFADNLPSSTKIIGSYNDDKENYNLTLNYLSDEWQDKLSKTPKDKTHCEIPNDESDDIETTTVSFKETVDGWTSRKSYYTKTGNVFYPLESGESLNDKYYSFNKGLIWEHASNSVYNNFYGTQYDSSVNVVINDVTESIKGFKTLNYAGTDSRRYKYGTSTGLSGLSIEQVVYQQIAPSIINSETVTPGWYTNYINTDMEEGQIKEFVKKENKYFNKIKGLKTFYKDNCDNNVDSSAFQTQGLGFAAITSSAPSAFNLTVNIDTSCSGTGGFTPDTTKKFWYLWSCNKPGSNVNIDIRQIASDQLVKCGIESFYNNFPNGYSDIDKNYFSFKFYNASGVNVNTALYNENNQPISDSGKFLYIEPAATPDNNALNANVSGTTVPNTYFILTVTNGVITAKTQYNTLAGCGTPLVAVDFALFVGYGYRGISTNLLTGTAAQHGTPSGRAALAKTQLKTYLNSSEIASVSTNELSRFSDIYKYSGATGLVVGAQLHNDIGALSTDGIFAHNTDSAPTSNGSFTYRIIPPQQLKTDASWSNLDSAWKFITFENGIVTHITTMNTL